MKKYQNIVDKLISIAAFILLVILWEIFVQKNHVPAYILPAPSLIIKNFGEAFSIMEKHIQATVIEAGVGFTSAVLISLIIAVIMDSIPFIKKALYPLLLVTQTIPIISIAPLFIIWFGYGIFPKILVVQLVCFFPITVSLLESLAAVDQDLLNLLKSMGANKLQLYRMVKIPAALPGFFSGLKISATYSIMGAVIADWLGAEKGLGLFMVLSQKSFQVDRVFAAIIVITILSLGVFKLVDIIENLVMPWKEKY